MHAGKAGDLHDACCGLSRGQHPLVHRHQQQWDHAANAHLGDIVIKPYSNREAWWTCQQCPDGHRHSWLAIVRDRTRGNECPQCSGRQGCKHNSLATRAPLIAAQWDYEANDATPDTVVAQSHKKARWYSAEWDYSQNQGQPSDYTASSAYLAWWSSSQRGSWPQTIRLRTSGKRQKAATLKCNEQIESFMRLF
ncbi:hypothetical protein ABBQ38_010784 [Trebouxia sp. C0009 RCD-2024]